MKSSLIYRSGKVKTLLFLITFSLILMTDLLSQKSTDRVESIEIAELHKPSRLMHDFAPATYTNDNFRNITEGNNLFAFQLYHQLAVDEKDVNLFYSPFSITTALAMVYGGARGETAQQIAKTMNFSYTGDFHSKYRNQLDSLAEGTDSKVRLDIANGMWVQKDFKLLDSYIDMAKSNYNSEVSDVDFVDAIERENTRKYINNWVETKTNDKIKELLSPDDLNSASRIVLINAIYFFADWESPFSKEKTSPGNFFMFDNTTIEATMMSQKNHYNYYEDKYIKALEIPYSGNKASMIIFLPNKEVGIAGVEEKFDYNYYNTVFSSFSSQQVDLVLPKYTTKYKTYLQETLSQMGMPLAFDRQADFSGITGRQDLCIDKVIHQAFISIDEKGTEAAAATAVTMKLTSAGPSGNKFFIVNRPFLFCIKDNETGSILFMGKIMKP